MLLGILIYAFGLLVQIRPPDQFSIFNFGLFIISKQHVVRINREISDTSACKSLEFNIPDFRGELITSFSRMGCLDTHHACGLDDNLLLLLECRMFCVCVVVCSTKMEK